MSWKAVNAQRAQMRGILKNISPPGKPQSQSNNFDAMLAALKKKRVELK